MTVAIHLSLCGRSVNLHNRNFNSFTCFSFFAELYQRITTYNVTRPPTLGQHHGLHWGCRKGWVRGYRLHNLHALIRRRCRRASLSSTAICSGQRRWRTGTEAVQLVDELRTQAIMAVGQSPPPKVSADPPVARCTRVHANKRHFWMKTIETAFIR